MINATYRGKVFHYGTDMGWVYGQFHNYYDGSFYNYITNIEGEYPTTNYYNVEAFTLGVGTGLFDINKKEIFTGDIVKHKYRRIWQTKQHVSIVEWNKQYGCFYLNDGTSNHRMRDDIIYEVIGNNIENKELSPVEKNSLPKFKAPPPPPVKKGKVLEIDDLPF